MLENPNIRYLIFCGQESLHLAGHAFVALHDNGIMRFGSYRRINGCKSPLPFVDEIPLRAIDEFQEEITLIDTIGVEDVGLIPAKIDECAAEAKARGYTRAAYDSHMPEIDSYSGKKYSASSRAP